MNDNEFWIACWKVLGAVAVGVVVSVGGCTVAVNYRAAALVQNGADPLRVGCAMTIVNGLGAVQCSILAATP